MPLRLVEADDIQLTGLDPEECARSAPAPVRLGPVVIAYLVPSRKTGERKPRVPDSAEGGASEKERYDAALTLLNSFADLLSQYAEDFCVTVAGSEPVGIIKARKFIHANLGEQLPLGIVARHAALSESHFCRLFKEHLGLTLTEYVAQARIGWAKRELLRTGLRVSEIAFKVGFQSLSQFNRRFVRIVGCSPSTYRRARLAQCRRMGT